LIIIGAVAHCTVLLWAFLDLWNLRNSAYLKPGIEEPDSLFHVPLMLSMMALCLAMLFYITYGTFKLFRDAIRRRFPGRYGVLGVYTLILMGVEIALLLWMMLFHVHVFRDSMLLYLGFACLFLFEWAIRRLSLLSPWLGETLLITTAEKSLSVDVYDPAVWALILCIYNVVVSVLWYWLRYNPEGTVNPSWTRVFG
jgi:hypothetical protein